MSKNIIFIPAIDAGRNRHNAYKYSIQSWKNWADKNNSEVIVWENALYPWSEMTIPWQRYYLFDMLENNKIDYDQVLMADSDTIVHPDTPNFFEYTTDYSAVMDCGCWEWTGRSIRHYANLFDNFKLERGYYFNGGFQIVNESNKEFFKLVLEFYKTNKSILLEKQKAGLGTDQTCVNYLTQMSGVKVEILPATFNLHSLSLKNLINLGQPWPADSLENLYEQGWVYHFNSIPKNSLNRNTDYFLERAYRELWSK